MGNCLKTQLKEVVQNNNLNKLGVLKFTIPASDVNQNLIAITPPTGKTIKVTITGATFSDGSNEISSSTWFNPQVLPHNEEAVVEIESKYDLVDVQFFTTGMAIDANQLEYTNITRLELSSQYEFWDVRGELSKVLKSSNNLNILKLGKCGITGNLSDIANKTTLTTFTVRDAPLKGELASLSNLINLEFLGITSYTDNYIIGTVESFLSGLYLNTKRSGELNLDLRFCNSVYFHDTLVTEMGESFIVVFTNSGLSVNNWDKSVTFATYNGTDWTYNF